MKFIDNFLSLFDLRKLQGEGEGYNDDENEDDDDDDNNRRFQKKDKPVVSSYKDRNSYSDQDDNYDQDDNEERYNAPEKKVKPLRTSRVSKANSKNNSKTKVIKMGDTNMEVCAIKPTSVEEDEREIADTLLSGISVIINLEDMINETEPDPNDIELFKTNSNKKAMAQRIIDFVSGVCYSINGNLQPVSKHIFLATPKNVTISGDFYEKMSVDLEL